MARTDAVSIELAKRRYSEALAAYTLEQWRSLAQDLGLSSNSPSSTPSAHDNALDSSDDSGSDVRINGVVNGVGTVSLTLGEADCAFFCFFETHGVPCSSCTYRGAISIP